MAFRTTRDIRLLSVLSLLHSGKVPQSLLDFYDLDISKDFRGTSLSLMFARDYVSSASLVGGPRSEVVRYSAHPIKETRDARTSISPLVKPSLIACVRMCLLSFSTVELPCPARG